MALIGEIFFSWLDHAAAWGATSKASAFVNAASNALYYEIGVFLLVALLVPFLKARKLLPEEMGHPPEPILADA